MPRKGSYDGPLKKITQKHLQFAIWMVSGYCATEAGKLMGVPSALAMRWARDPGVRAEIDRLRERIEDTFIEKQADTFTNLQLLNKVQEEASEAVQQVGSLMREANSETVKLRAARDILDRAGIQDRSGEDEGGAKVIVITDKQLDDVRIAREAFQRPPFGPAARN